MTTKNQYRKANKIAFPALLLLLGFIFISLISSLLAGNTSGYLILQIAAVIIAAIGCVVSYILKGDSRIGAILLMSFSTASYVVIVFTNSNDYVFLYGLVILFIAMVYMNVRLIVCGNGILLLANIIRVILKFNPDDPIYIESIVVTLAALFLCAVVSIQVSRTLLLFNAENIAAVSSIADKQTENNRKMTSVAENIIQHFQTATTVVEKLKGCVETNHFSMQNIDESTASTANTIQQEAQMCGEIQQITDQASQQIQRMMASSNSTSTTINDGKEDISRLFLQAQNVTEASQVVEDVIRRLTEQVNEVQNIVSSILQISNQTSLLALNASIEAARAGEAGRGFSVVADEIRKLSEQTKNATNRITAITDQLIYDTQKANESIGQSSLSVQKQNEMIENTNTRFSQIQAEMEKLDSDIQNTHSNMQSILNATNSISDSITQLSATSQEVAASASEGTKTSATAVAYMEDCNKSLQDIFLLAKNLQDSIIS